MKFISKKSITFSIILLFIGVSFSSGISVDTETKSIDECKICKETSGGRLICDLLHSVINLTDAKTDYYYHLYFNEELNAKKILYFSLFMGWTHITISIANLFIYLDCDNVKSTT